MDDEDPEVLSTFAQRHCCTGFSWAAASLVVGLLSVAILNVNDLLQLFWLGTLVNVALSITKMALAQVTAHQKALMADAVHGLGDTAAEVVTAFAYVEAARPPDKEHPWGHGKIESIGAVVVTCILLYIAFSMGYDSITSLVPLLTDALERRGKAAAKEAPEPSSEPPERPKCPSQTTETGLEKRVRRAAIAVGVASVFLKEALYHATLDAGEQVQSKLAVATAWHHRSDSLAAGVALTSQLGSALGWPGLDPLGGAVVAAMLGHSAVDSLRDSMNDLLDYNSASDNDEDPGDHRFSCGSRSAFARTITRVQGVRNHTLRTRRMGPFCLVDVTIVVDARISASAASMIAESVHDLVIHDFRPAVTDVLVHVDPDGSPQSHRLETHSEATTVAEQVETLQMLSPEDLEIQIRAALLQDSGDPDLPQITEVTELHTYYYMEETGPDHDGKMMKMSTYVDVKVDFRLQQEDIPIRRAVAAGRAARERVRSALPGIVRDVDANLQLDIDAEESSAPSKKVPTAPACALVEDDTHGRWGAEPRHCASATRLATSFQGVRANQDRHLQQVKLIWERGPEARKVRAPYVHLEGYGEKITVKQMPRWHPLLVHWARQQHGDPNASVQRGGH